MLKDSEVFDERGVIPSGNPDDERRNAWRIREVQNGRENEAADLADLERSIFSDAWTKKGIEETLCQDNTMALGLWEGDFLIGYVILYYVLDEGEIARIAVEPSRRRQGAAGKLFGKLIEICGGKGIGRLMLEVRRSNEAAISFYRKCGFTEDGTRKDYYADPCEDAILMSKILHPEELT